MSQPWMPLYIGDYLADTAHLKVAEHGAYLLLMMHYWRTCGLPTDDATLARIARMSAAEWKKAKPVIAPMFDENWKHKRIEFELTESARISAAGKKGGEASGAARRAKPKTANKSERSTNDRSTINERSFNDLPTIDERSGNDLPTKREALQPQSQEVVGGGGARADAGELSKPKSLISEEAFRTAGDVLQAMGLDREHPMSVGAPYSIQHWLNGGIPSEIILLGVRKVMGSRKGDPPGALKYFENAILREHAQLQAPLPKVEIRERETVHVTADRASGDRSAQGAIARLQARVQGQRGDDSEPNPDALRLLPQS